MLLSVGGATGNYAIDPKSPQREEERIGYRDKLRWIYGFKFVL
jgi:hypothetical protein